MKQLLHKLLRNFGLFAIVFCAMAFAPVEALCKPLMSYGKTSAKQKSLRLQTGETVAEFDFVGFSALPLGSAFDFNQPDGALIPMQLDRIEVGASGAKTYIARITEHGTQYRAYFTEFDGHVLANIDLPDTTLKLEPQAGQDAPHQVLLRNTKAAGMKPVEATHTDARYHFPTPEQSLADHFDRIAKGYENPRTPDRSEDHQKVAPSPQTTIDIMVAYTPALVSARSPFTDAGARARIDQLIAYANQGYLDSDIAITLRLVNAVATTYTDTNADDVALDELTGISVTRPASLSSIPTLRDTYGADLVVLLRPYRTAHAYCGVAWVNGAPNSGASIASDAPTGFAVVSEGNNVDGGGSYCHDTSFPHELGHNMGMDHDRAQVRQSVVDSCNAGAGCPTGCVPGNASSPCMTFAAYHYSFGYIGPNFGTIMSYYNGTRLNRFSNPLQSNCSGTGAAPFYVCGVTDPDSTQPKYANAGANGALTLNNTRVGVAAFRPTKSDVTLGGLTNAGIGDVNGDGRGDLILKHSSGDVYVWFMNGPVITGGGKIGNVTSDWSIIGIRDVNGDGRADILWRNINGWVAVWLLNGMNAPTGGLIGQLSTDWHAVGVGDFNGDGRGDILWRTDAGQYAMWFLNGTQAPTGGNWTYADPTWRVIGVGDANGDGRDDVLLRHTSGNVTLWKTNGLAQPTGGSIGSVGSEWSVIGIGDVNGDGRADIIWRSASGYLAQWQLNDMSAPQGGIFAFANNQMIQGVLRETDGDSRADMLWLSDDGFVAHWKLNGMTAPIGTWVSPVGSGWSIK